MTNESMIDIARDFSSVPAGRFYGDGPFSGEYFREEFLRPKLGSNKLTIVLDGAFGLPVSFLEEAFGGLIRQGFSAEDLKKKIQFVAVSDRMRRYPDAIWHYILAAEKKKFAV